MDPEVQHVNDISQKLATFTIDTDTNSSIHTGSDQGDDSTETESMIDRSVQLSQCICLYCMYTSVTYRCSSLLNVVKLYRKYYTFIGVYY